MKIFFITLIFFIFSFNGFALGGYGALPEVTQKALKSIVNQLGIIDNNNKIKEKIYDANSWIFEGEFGWYWIGLNDLSSSNYKDGKEKGYIELGINNGEYGTVFVTYMYKKEAKQIIITTRQIRYGSKNIVLEEYSKRKNSSEEYEVRHENDKFALVQEAGKVNFAYFHVSGDTGSVSYVSQRAIDI